MLKNIVFGVKVATNDDFCQGTVALSRCKVLRDRRGAGVPRDCRVLPWMSKPGLAWLPSVYNEL